MHLHSLTPTCERARASALHPLVFRHDNFSSASLQPTQRMCLMIPVCLSTICFIGLKVASSILNLGCLVIFCLLSWEKANN